MKIEEITKNAVLAALSEIDNATHDCAKFSPSCGDKLAGELDTIIRKALTELITSEYAPV